VGWWCIAVLVATGLVNLSYRGWLRWDGVHSVPAFWGTPAGTALGAKLAAVTVMVVLSAVHDFVVGPAAGRATAGSAEAVALRARAAWMGRMNAVVGVVLVVAAVRLTRG
jgi:putative copper export protein